LIRARTALVGLLVASACAAPPPPPARRADPHNARALAAIAQRFNDDYQAGRYTSVWQRWDRESRSVISEADYVQRHRDCFAAPGAPAKVETVTAASGGWWLVRYEIGGEQFTDYWTYQAGRWQFDLPRSNPSAVALYRLPVRAYERAVGCQGAR
jgi:hypothetical protein